MGYRTRLLSIASTRFDAASMDIVFTGLLALFVTLIAALVRGCAALGGKA